MGHIMIELLCHLPAIYRTYDDWIIMSSPALLIVSLIFYCFLEIVSAVSALLADCPHFIEAIPRNAIILQDQSLFNNTLTYLYWCYCETGKAREAIKYEKHIFYLQGTRRCIWVLIKAKTKFAFISKYAILLWILHHVTDTESEHFVYSASWGSY